MSEPIRLARPDVGAPELAALAEVVATGMLTMGPKVAELEASLARACGTAEAVAVSSGTAALHLAMMALGISPGDEVIVPAYTFPATANAVELCGGRAVLVDVDPETFNLDLSKVAEAVTDRTKAVVAVHLFGRPVEWEELQTAVPQEVVLVEDAAGALGARYRDTPCGALGVMGCLSFHPRKIVTTGEGGAVTTDDAELADADSALPPSRHRAPRRVRHPRARPELPAAGSPLRDRDPAGRPARSSCSPRANGWPAGTPSGSSTSCRPRPRPTATATAGRRTSSSSTVATRLCTRCASEGIEVQIGTYALHHLGAYRDRGSFPGADRAFARALALPFATTMTEAECDRVAARSPAFVDAARAAGASSGLDKNAL